MSDTITLTLRAPLDGPISVHGLHPHRCAELSEREIAATPVWVGRRRAEVGDFFAIRGERSTTVRVEGSTGAIHHLGAGMAGGELIVDGDAGTETGAGMSGGTLSVRGSVGDQAGMAMSGGLLRIDGQAGNHLGGAVPGAAKGMSGGEIIVLGSAGADAAARLRRGLIVIAGTVGADAGRAMIAGSIVLLGACGAHPGRGNKRGSIVACGGITIPATYRYACTFNPPSVRLTMTYLKRRHGMAIDARLLDGAYRRHCGDAGEPGKGEILELSPPGPT